MSDLIAEIGPEHAAAQLAASIVFADGASGPSRIRFYGTTKPTVGGAPGGDPMAEIVLGKPCATLSDGVMTLHPATPEGGMVLISGVPLWGRWDRSDGLLVVDGTASDPDHDGFFQIIGGTTLPGDESPTLQAGGLVLLGALTFL
ncbi:hypothetical protein LJR118_000301 [Acidovorax sp. LjRoot118]|uniref:hypothetical protein n=1 Tax=Acidovorax sp. LjRoot118 TaxID=3342256 RepID=UPI003ECEB528